MCVPAHTHTNIYLIKTLAIIKIDNFVFTCFTNFKIIPPSGA